MDGKTEREKISTRAGFTGLTCNLLLFAFKLAVGLLVNSVSIIADAFNNLSDAGSSIVSLVGSWMAGKRADEDHPFGHGRIEYIAASIVSFLVLLVGVETLTSSFNKLLHPEKLSFSYFMAALLLVFVLVKCLLGLFYKGVAEKTNSDIFRAAASDSFSDCIITGATFLSLIIYGVSGRNIDGLVGVIVSLIVIYNGFCIARQTVAPLIGTSIDPTLYYTIVDFVENHEKVSGVHDLIVHNYGPSTHIASIHVEMDSNMSMDSAHEIVDNIEKEVLEKLGVYLVIHVDPVDNNDLVLYYRQMVAGIIRELSSRSSFHDFRIKPDEDSPEQLKLEFDLVTPWEVNGTDAKILSDQITKEIIKRNANLKCYIHIDRPLMHVHSVEEEAAAKEHGIAASRKAIGQSEEEGT